MNILLFLIVHTGLMGAAILQVKDAEHYIQALEQFRQQHRQLKGGFLIQDGDPTHTAQATQAIQATQATQATQAYFAKTPTWWRPRYTPVHASWLNQAEILIHIFFRHYYLKRQSWTNRDEFIQHVMASWPEYNRRYVYPIEWAWTNYKMRQWFEKHKVRACFKKHPQ